MLYNVSTGTGINSEQAVILRVYGIFKIIKEKNLRQCHAVALDYKMRNIRGSHDPEIAYI
jgi:hypothetical protein